MSAASTPAVYAAICGVMADIGREGIAKARNNAAQGFKFRGVDDVYNALNAILARHHLIMLPRVLARTVEERTTKSGGVMFYVSVDMEYDLISAADGSKHTIRVSGEAMDSGDKATNKAMSAAYKYAAFQAFCIPTEGDNDADAHTPPPIAPRSIPPAPEWSEAARQSFLNWLDVVSASAGVSVSYADVASFCRSLGKPEPSAMSDAQVQKFRDAIDSDASGMRKRLITSIQPTNK